jgi:hypothetical protein
MRVFRSVVCVIAVVFLGPSLLYAQASIAGVVRVTSGAVLPGVTVEASSDVLIEKVRTVVTDGSGLYRIPGMIVSNQTQDVGGSSVPTQPDWIMHGSRVGDGRLSLDGITLGQRGSGGAVGGVTLSGGISTGRRTEDSCEIRA